MYSHASVAVFTKTSPPPSFPCFLTSLTATTSLDGVNGDAWRHFPGFKVGLGLCYHRISLWYNRWRARRNCVEVFTYYCRASQIEYFLRMSLVSVFLGAYLLPARRKGNHSAFHFLCQFSSWIRWYWAILPLFFWFIVECYKDQHFSLWNISIRKEVKHLRGPEPVENFSTK